MFFKRECLTDDLLLEKIQNETFLKVQETSELISNVKKFENDSDRKIRLKKNLCKPCFYLSGDVMACSAFTTTICVSCSKEMTFGSSETDKLCPDCAKKYGVCKYCLADIDLKKRRKL